MSFIPQGNRGDDSLTLRRNHDNVILVRACKTGVILQIIGNATACLPWQLPSPRNRTQKSNSHRALYGIERIVPDQRGLLFSSTRTKSGSSLTGKRPVILRLSNCWRTDLIVAATSSSASASRGSKLCHDMLVVFKRFSFHRGVGQQGTSHQRRSRSCGCVTNWATFSTGPTESVCCSPCR